MLYLRTYCNHCDEPVIWDADAETWVNADARSLVECSATGGHFCDDDEKRPEMTNEETHYMILVDYDTGNVIRAATDAELEASDAAAIKDGGRGVITTDDGITGYVI